jgi:Aldo/keto reductase family/Putative Ig domain
MEYRPLGRTGVHVSKLCLGTMMFGAWGNTDHEDSIRIIHRALDAGINFVDTADAYSAGESEEIVGKALRDRRDDVVLATKFAANTSGRTAPIATISGSATGISGPSGVAVAPPLIVRTHKLIAARIGRVYRTRLHANLGTTPYHWNVIAGKLPPGLRLRRDGTLSGRPDTPGSFRFTVRVRDTARPAMTATRRLAVVVRRS